MSEYRASGVWLGNAAWPSGRSPGAFARDVFRLEKCTTDREKAFAFYKWFLRCMNRGPSLFLPGMGGYIRCDDPTLLFTSWGHNQCTGWGWVAAEALNAAGVKARRAVAFASGHTFYEVWYKGLDGKEAWHAFDPFVGWYFTKDDGEVASCDELGANPDLVANPRPGGPSRLGHHPERSCVLHRYKAGDLLDIEQPVCNDELAFELRPGMSFSSLWRPELPGLHIGAGNRPDGANCDISLYDEEGKPRYPEHHAYWKNYVWLTPQNTKMINGGYPVRWHGCGSLRWQPLLFGEKVVDRAYNAVFENGTVRPSGPKKHCEVWWHIKLPYLASYLRIGSGSDSGGGDLIGLSVSPDGGKTMRAVHWGGSLPKLVELMPSEPGSLQCVREFWLRLDMSSQSAHSPLRIRGLQINLGYQVNMHVLPRLVPGANELYLQAEKMDGVKLEAEWNYTRGDDELGHKLVLDKAGCEARRVDPGIERPEQAVMRGVTVRCLPR